MPSDPFFVPHVAVQLLLVTRLPPAGGLFRLTAGRFCGKFLLIRMTLWESTDRFWHPGEGQCLSFRRTRQAIGTGGDGFQLEQGLPAAPVGRLWE